MILNRYLISVKMKNHKVNKIRKAKILFCATIIIIAVSTCKACFARDETSNASNYDIIESQKESLNISGFIKEADEYTKDVFADTNMGELLNSAITGTVDNKKIMLSIWNLFGSEFASCITTIGSIIVIIVIHSIMKSISDGLENKSISQITYYVQYILIVTLIMTNFSDVLEMVKESINNLVGFMNLLIPILITLMMTTGSIVSSSTLQPILLFIITFIGNFIKDIISIIDENKLEMLEFNISESKISIDFKNIIDDTVLKKIDKFVDKNFTR